MTHKNEIDTVRRQFLGGSIAAAGMVVAPGVLLHQVAQAKPADQPVSSKQRWGMLIDTNKCSKGCDACVRGCKTEHGWGETETHSALEQQAQWIRKVDLRDKSTGYATSLPLMCQHCEHPPCVDVCPTGASYKRAEDGIVLVNPDTCIGCKLCSWACPYGAREYDHADGVMKKCTLCVDRIYNETFEPQDRIPACVRACPTGARHFGDLGDASSAVSKLVSERGGYDLMPELGFKPVNKYLPPRPRRDGTGAAASAATPGDAPVEPGSVADRLFAWADRMLTR